MVLIRFVLKRNRKEGYQQIIQTQTVDVNTGEIIQYDTQKTYTRKIKSESERLFTSRASLFKAGSVPHNRVSQTHGCRRRAVYQNERQSII